MDMKLEVIVVPVSDVARSKSFYTRLGWRLDADIAVDENFRVVQVTPPGSPASVIFGTSVTLQAPGSAQGLHLIVNDIDAAAMNSAKHMRQRWRAKRCVPAMPPRTSMRTSPTKASAATEPKIKYGHGG